MKQDLHGAIRAGDVGRVSRLLQDNPDCCGNTVNWQDENGWTALHCACHGGHDTIVALLLRFSSIDVNRKENNDNTALILACFWGELSCIRLLLKDPRVDVTATDNCGLSALDYAVTCGMTDVIKWWIALRQEENLGYTKTVLTTLIEEEVDQSDDIPTLLRSFRDDPDQTRSKVRLELGIRDEEIANLFALIIFLCDALLTVKSDQSLHHTTRFFNITTQLPIELQMLVCHRAFNSAKQNVASSVSEVGFRQLAQSL